MVLQLKFISIFIYVVIKFHRGQKMKMMKISRTFGDTECLKV